VAKRLGRRYIGFERDHAYAAAAEARIAASSAAGSYSCPIHDARHALACAFSD